MAATPTYGGSFACIFGGCNNSTASCTYTCYTALGHLPFPFPPPPPQPPPPPPLPSSQNHIAPFLIVTVSILGILFLLLSTCTIILRLWFTLHHETNTATTSSNHYLSFSSSSSSTSHFLSPPHHLPLPPLCASLGAESPAHPSHTSSANTPHNPLRSPTSSSQAGATIIHPKNYHTSNFTEFLNLKKKFSGDDDCDSLGVWDGRKMWYLNTRAAA